MITSCVTRLTLSVILLCFYCHAFADSTFIKFGSSWKYLDDGTDPGTSWKEKISPATDSWATGKAEFGYGNGDERTLVRSGANVGSKHITTYFRTSINITDISSFSFFKLKAYVDDGMVVYVNGRQVCLANMPDGIVSYNTVAFRDNPDNGNIITRFSIPSGSFVNGANTIAVEVHQSGQKSNDLTFDLELAGITGTTATAISRGPLLQMVSENGITISWRTNEKTSSRIQYGSSENLQPLFATDDKLTTDHEMRITGLMPDTKYYYSIGAARGIMEGSYRNFFTTSPPANTTRKIRIGVFGDAGTGNSHQKGVRDSYLRLFKKEANPELAIMLGDNAYNTGTDKEYQSNFFNVYDENVFDNHVVFPIPGNHEYYSPGVPYFSIFSLPTKGESGGLPSGTESYYSFNYGNIHFVMLNSMGHDGGKPLSDSTGAQALWLKKDLEANTGKSKWTIACLHHPPYTNGTHHSDNEPELYAIRQQITPILERYGVDAVLAGHSHVYERSFLIQGHTGDANSFKPRPPGAGNLVSGSSARYDGSDNSCPYFTVDTIAKKGTVYVVAGSAGQIGGGTNPDMPLFYYKNYSGTSGGEHGILYLEVQDNRLDAKFIGTSGTVRDQFTIMKGVNTKKNITVEVNKPVDLKASWVGSYNWIPAPPSGKDKNRNLTVTHDKVATYTYLVKDSIINARTCIADTFEIKITAASIITPLEFKAIQKYNKVLLNWRTGIELNTDYFTIEKSVNGRDFNMLTMIKSTVPSNTNLTTAASYEFEDKYPAKGINYYRLSKTNRNAQIVALDTRTLTFEAVKPFTFRIKSSSGNKNNVTIVIESAIKQGLQTRIVDLNGNVVFQYHLNAKEGINNVDLTLTKGIYVLSITGMNNEIFTEKFLLR
ncbi:MAG: metallophosphoesterase [Chitinophagaceae bacterium]